MKRLLTLCLAAALALLLTACGDAANGGGSTDASRQNGASQGSDASMDSMEFDEGFFDAPFEPAAPEESAGGAPTAGRKVILTAGIRMETTDFDTAAQAMAGLVEEFSGYFESRSLSNYDAYRVIRCTIRVPAERFEDFCGQMGEICHVLDLNTGEEDVGEAYYDTEGRLTTQRTKLERLQKLLSEAENMADIITIESAISDTELQIEYLTGSLRRYDALIDYATVTVDLREVYRLSNVPEPPQGFAGRMGEALSAGLTGAVTVCEELVIFLAHIWVLLVILLAALAVFLLLRRRRRRPAPPPEEKP